jgi:phosphoribosylanthranilate isomerase
VSAPAVKICGMTRRADTEAAVGAGAAYLGVVFAPSSPRVVTPAAAASLLDGLDVRRVGVFVDAPVVETVSAAAVAGLDVLQLHGDEDPETVRALRDEGAWHVWKAVRVRGPGDVERALERFAGVVDGFLLDAWSPAAHGGTGSRFGWEEVAPLRDLVPTGVLFVVAGGLRAENLERAVRLLRPDALDLSSGVEVSPGVKDAAAIGAVMTTLARIRP